MWFYINRILGNDDAGNIYLSSLVGPASVSSKVRDLLLLLHYVMSLKLSVRSMEREGQGVQTPTRKKTTKI